MTAKSTKLPDGISDVCRCLNCATGGIVFGSLTDQKTPFTSNDQIVTQVYTFLKNNLKTGTTSDGIEYSFNQPSSYKYGTSQWLWGTQHRTVLITIDSGSHQILWARKDVNVAIADLRTLLKRQLPDGRIPEEINWLADKQGFFAKLGIRFQWSHVAYNDISQMPVLPYRCSASLF